MYTTEYIKQHYEGYDEDNRLKTPYGQIEFFTTKRYIDKYLQPGDRILEVGAGTGTYSHHYAQCGFDVTAIELLEHNIEIFKRNLEPGENIAIMQGNALDLSFIRDNTHDVTLLLGPMYHLYTPEDQLKALSEAVRVTKKGGYIFVAYCSSDACIIQHGFCQSSFLSIPEKRKLIEPGTFKLLSPPEEIFALSRIEDIDALDNQLPVTRLHLVATDGMTDYMREYISAMTSELYDLYLQYHFATCERKDLIGASNHFLDVLQK